jgi:hypothetical protein
MKFLKKLKKRANRLKHNQLSELALMTGAMALLIVVAVIIRIGAPSVARAFYIPVTPSYTPVMTGGYTTISWTAYDADYCYIGYSASPTAGHLSGETCYGGGTKAGYGGTYCSLYVQGRAGRSYNIAGSATAGPMNGATTYNIACYNQGGWNSGSGSNSITVYPTPRTPTTLNYFYASPSTIPYNTSATLYYSGNRGTDGVGLYLANYGYLSGWSGSIARGPLTGNATYGIYTVDNYYGWVGPWNTTVTVSAPVAPKGPCNDIPAATTLPNGCVAPAVAPGTCIPSGGSYSAGSNTCTCPVGKHLEGTACVANPLCANGLNDSYAPSCACPAGQYQPGGVSYCVVLPVCTNGLSQAYSPSCTCPAGQVQVSGGSTCVPKGEIHSMTAQPSRVRKGNTGTVSWNTSAMVSCTLKGPVNGAMQTLSTELSGTRTVTITNQSVYTLSCADQSGASYSSTATINLIPEVEEL